MQRPWRGTADQLAPLAYSPCPWMTPPSMVWAFSHQSLIKKRHYKLSWRHILWSHLSMKVSRLKMTRQVAIKTAGATTVLETLS